jgi:hypothetical protein
MSSTEDSSDYKKKKPRNKNMSKFQGSYSTSSSQSEEEVPKNKKMNKKYGNNSSSESYSDSEESNLKSKVDDLEKYKTDFPIKRVEFKFDAIINTNKVKTIKLNANQMRMGNIDQIRDFPHKMANSKMNKDKEPLCKASENSDIITKMQLNIKHTYPGSLVVEFPTIQQPGQTSYDAQDHVTIPITQSLGSNETTETVVAIKRELDKGHYEFLSKFPGQTIDTLDSTSHTNTRFKGKGYAIKSNSPLTHFMTPDLENKINYKKSDDLYEMKTDQFKDLKSKAEESLHKQFAFSNITNQDFHLCIRPQMDPITQQSVENDIKMLQSKIKKSSKYDGKEIKQMESQIKSMQAEGFMNFYNMTIASESDKRENAFEKFKTGLQYKITGTVYIEYCSVYKPVKNK